MKQTRKGGSPMSNIDTKSKARHTVVLSGAGPKIKFTSTNGAKITVISGNKVKTIDLAPDADVVFAA
jgi:hypothetical protein